MTVCYNVAMSPITDALMCTVIGLNLVVLVLLSEDQSAGMSHFIDIASNVFTAAYTAEALLKIVGLRPVWYARPRS